MSSAARLSNAVSRLPNKPMVSTGVSWEEIRSTLGSSACSDISGLASSTSALTKAIDSLMGDSAVNST